MLTWLRFRELDSHRAAEHYPILDGIRVGIRTRYVKATDRWSVDILRPDGSAMVAGLRAVPGTDLLRPFKHLDGMPQGQLFVYGNPRQPPDLTTADTTIRLYYRPAAEVTT